MKHLLIPVAVLLSLSGAGVRAASSVDLEFNGSGTTLADTGFDGVYKPDPASFSVGGGTLSITSQPGDIFGDYENPINSARNVFYSDLDASPATASTVDTKLNVRGLNVNFHGGGIWMGTDENHYIRLGVINNTFEGGLSIETLRENMELWPAIGGAGGDIKGHQRGLGITSPQQAPLDIYLRLVREGHTASSYYSMDGITFTPLASFGQLALGPADGPNVQGGFKVGAYAFGGPGGASPLTASFDYLRAGQGNAIPEPGTLAFALTGLAPALALVRRRRA